MAGHACIYVYIISYCIIHIYYNIYIERESLCISVIWLFKLYYISLYIYIYTHTYMHVCIYIYIYIERDYLSLSLYIYIYIHYIYAGHVAGLRPRVLIRDLSLRVRAGDSATE